MYNLLAYIPVVNQRHIDWFRKWGAYNLHLISQDMAKMLIPRLSRNLASLPTRMIASFVRETKLVRGVSIFDPNHMRYLSHGTCVLPDEDISHVIAEKYLEPQGIECEFEMIWSRWDMTAVYQNQRIVTGVYISESQLDNELMKLAEAESVKSPDWWRQIGAIAVSQSGGILAVACNTHLPNEYETYIFGDPRLNVDAGQQGVYCSLHAERAVIALCAKRGVPLAGASLYVTVFPCEDCAREIAFAGIAKLFFREGYSVMNAKEVLRSNCVTIVQVLK
jgi:dCMP deaminase